MSDALCILAAGKVLALAVSSFTLSWTHTVERTEWWEHWQVRDGALEVVEARVQGSGAGMDPPQGAVPVEGGWLYKPAVAPLGRLVLAASGAGGSAWELCTKDQCRVLAAESGNPIELWPAGEKGCSQSVSP